MELSEKAKKGIFDAEDAKRGYAMNKLMFTLNDEANRAEFLQDREAYCEKFGLNEEQKAAVLSGDRSQVVAAGGNMYFGIKLVRTYRNAEKKEG